MKKIISVILVLSLAFCTVACSKDVANTPKEKYTASFLDLFDTASKVIAFDTSQEEFDLKYEKFHNELETYDHLYDIYNSYEGLTNLYVVNKEAGKSPVKVDKKIIDMLLFGKEMYDYTNGNVNICFGAVLRLWHNEREYAKDNDNPKLPDMTALQEANKHTNIDDLIIDEENSTVFFNDPEMQLDVGAIAKGFAVQRITEWTKENLWQDVAISIGGNVSTLGYKNDGKTPWKIGIENPQENATDYLELVNITDTCVVTSGDYQRYYTVDGKRYCHIINKDTLMPSEYMASVSILCKDSALGDALSTALFNMPIEEGEKFVNSLDGVEAVWVNKNYEKTYSKGFNNYLAGD